MKNTYQHVVVGGTFDRFHRGHQKLIDTAFEQSEKVSVGISTDTLHRHKLLTEIIESYSLRENAVKDYLREKGYTERATFVPISDFFGTTLQDQSIQAIFVTEENAPHVKRINARRQEIGFEPLKMVVVDYVKGDDGEIITSERIRSGEIDSNGHSYAGIFEKKKILHLPERMREELHTPIGEVVKDTDALLQQIDKDAFIVAVGDIISASLKAKDREADISIVDLKTRRESISLLQKVNQKKILNKAGTIQLEAVNGYREAMKKRLTKNTKQTLIIEGEEDLLALPAILLAPLESIVLYGQYDMGIVINRVTEEKKREIENLVKRFF